MSILIVLGNCGIKIVKTFGRAGLMLFDILISNPEFRKNIPLLVRQLYNIGVMSTPVISISGLFVGIALGLHGYSILITYGAETNLGMLLALTLFRELGPVISALLFAGSTGSALTAEMKLMRVTEQLSSMEIMAINPIHRVIFPRFWAGVISLPLLTIIFIATGILGGSLVGIQWKGINASFFWSVMQNTIDLKIDLINCLIKSLLFSIMVTWIALFNGYDTVPTSSKIHHVTTYTVVYSSLTILGLDFIMTTLMFGN